jgi:hypothetical protein
MNVRGYIRSSQLRGLKLGTVQDWYSETVEALDAAELRKDKMEICKLLVDLQLLGHEIDARLDSLFESQEERRQAT